MTSSLFGSRKYFKGEDKFELELKEKIKRRDPEWEQGILSSGKSINTDLEEKMSLWKENRESGVIINGKLDNESKLE